MIPFGDDQGGIRIVAATMALFLGMAGVYVYEWTLPPEVLKSFVQDFGIMSRQLAQELQPVAEGEPAMDNAELVRRGALRLITYPFFHSGPIHAVSCTFALWVFGARLESRTSWWRFLLFFLMSTVAGGIAQLQWGTPSSVVHIGATVPVGSAVLAYLVLYPRARIRVFLLPLPLFLRVPAVVSVAVFGVLQFHKVQDFFGLECGRSLDYIPQLASVLFCGLVLGPLLLGWQRNTGSKSKATKSKRAPQRRGSYARK